MSQHHSTQGSVKTPLSMTEDEGADPVRPALTRGGREISFPVRVDAFQDPTDCQTHGGHCVHGLKNKEGGRHTYQVHSNTSSN
jgi:hypothetical protein